MRFIIYWSIYDGRIFVWEEIGSKPLFVVCVLCEIQNKITVRLTCVISSSDNLLDSHCLLTRLVHIH